MDIPDPLSPLFPIVHRLWQGLQGYIPYPHIAAEFMFVLVALLLLVHMWGPQEYISYELVPDSPAVSCMSGSSNLDSFRDWKQVAV